MGIYKTIDDKILAVHEAISQKYQKATGNTNYTLMRHCGLLSGIFFAGTAIATAMSAMIANDGQVASYWPYCFMGGANVFLGTETAFKANRDARILEESSFQETVHSVKDKKAEQIKTKRSGYLRLLDNFFGLSLFAYGIDWNVIDYQPKSEAEAFFNDLTEYSFIPGAIAFILRASTSYLATCKPRKPEKKSLWEKVKSFFSIPKLAEVTSRYHAALAPYL